MLSMESVSAARVSFKSSDSRNISVGLVNNLKASHGVTSNGSKKMLAARIAPHTRSLTHLTGPSSAWHHYAKDDKL
jgi:hypothetical protein